MKTNHVFNSITSKRYYHGAKNFAKRHGLVEWEKALSLAGLRLKGKVVLDAGSGFGYEAGILHRRGARVFGVDSSNHLVRLAKKAYPKLAPRFVSGDIGNLPFRKNFFDLIICKYALHYLPTPDRAFKEFFRCLKSKGTLIFFVHHPISNLWYKKTKNYFRKEKIKLKIFSSVSVTQPTHPLTDYLSPYFLKHFDLHHFGEYRAAEPLHSKVKIPESLWVVAQKRNL